MTLSESILENGVRICNHYKENIDYLKQGTFVPGLVLVYWELKNETGSISQQEDKAVFWGRAKELRPTADKNQLIDTAIALFVFFKVTGEYL